VTNWQGPWGTGPYKLVDGFSRPDVRSDRMVLEANTDYWDANRFPRLQRIIFDNTIEQRQAVEMVKTGEGGVDVVTELRPLDTLRVAESPFAKVVKNRGSLLTVFGLFNVHKAEGRWRDVRLRQAANLAINREDLIRYAAKGNGVIIPALLPAQTFGHDPDLTPYPFAPTKTQTLLREAGYADGLALTLIAPADLEVQATVVSKMLEQSGFTVTLEILDPTAFNRKIVLSHLDQPPEHQPWDIALTSNHDHGDFAGPFFLYHGFALDGAFDWVIEEPELRRLFYEEVLGTVDRERQQQAIRQMERHTRDQAYFLFLYNPIQLFAVNKAVEFVPHVITILRLAETAVTEQHWSVRKQKAAVEE
jgi:peptide/nickel transport system substrate-binding protein